jgi:hypothetical protein
MVAILFIEKWLIKWQAFIKYHKPRTIARFFRIPGVFGGKKGALAGAPLVSTRKWGI